MLRTKFAIEIQKLKKSLIELFNESIEQHEAVMKALLAENIRQCQTIIVHDNQINKLYAEILDNAIWRIAKQQPVASDLRHIIGYMAIAKEIERIADYARNIANFYLQSQPPLKYTKYIEQLSKITLKIMKFIFKILNDETKWKRTLIQEAILLDDDVDREYNDITSNLIKIVSNKVTEEKIRVFTGIMQQLKYLERTGDHLVNIAETILFIAEGNFYESGR